MITEKKRCCSCPCDIVSTGEGTCQCCHPEVIQSTKDFYAQKSLDDFKARDDASCEDDSIKE